MASYVTVSYSAGPETLKFLNAVKMQNLFLNTVKMQNLLSLLQITLWVYTKGRRHYRIPSKVTMENDDDDNNQMLEKISVDFTNGHS